MQKCAISKPIFWKYLFPSYWTAVLILKKILFVQYYCCKCIGSYLHNKYNCRQFMVKKFILKKCLKCIYSLHAQRLYSFLFMEYFTNTIPSENILSKAGIFNSNYILMVNCFFFLMFPNCTCGTEINILLNLNTFHYQSFQWY